MILCGHSHIPFIGEIDSKKIFNVGSVGNSIDGDKRISYGIIDFSEGGLKLVNRRVEYPVDEVIEAAMKKGFPLTEEYKKIVLTGCEK